MVKTVGLEQLLLKLALQLAHGGLHGVQYRLGVVVFIDFLFIRGNIKQKISDIILGIAVEFLSLAAAHPHQAVERIAFGQHGGKVVPQADFAFKIKGNGIESAVNMQPAPRQHGCPFT